MSDKTKEQAAEENYVPYGPEWQKEIGKFSKPLLIQVIKQGSAQLATANATIAELQKENERLREANRWISVSERLPEEGQIVNAKTEVSTGKNIVFTNGKFMHRFYSQYSLEFIDVEYKNVTEWQPLPEPPTEVLTPNNTK